MGREWTLLPWSRCSTARISADVLPPPVSLLEAYAVVLEMVDAPSRQELPPLVERSERLAKEYKDRTLHWAGQF